MSIVIDDPKNTPERTPGDFRRTKYGAPMVADPSGELVKSGERKGQPKTLTYGRASSAGERIEDTYNLTKWLERRVALGIAVRLRSNTISDDELGDLLALEVDSPEWKEAADKVVVRAKEAAQTSLAADRGTHVHALTEDHDAGAVWLTRAQAGEDLGIGADVQAALVDAWRRLLDECGFEVLASEARVVHDGWRLAGTLDRVVRLTKDLTTTTGQVFTAGTVLVLDIKTGGMKLDYWGKYAPQIAAYAGGVPYDPETDTRGTWPFEIDQQWGLIAHIPVADILATGRCDISLVPVDLEAGRHAAELCVAAKAWGNRRDIFGAPLPVVTAEVVRDEAPAGGPAWVFPTPPDPFDGINGEPTAAERARTEALARMDAMTDEQKALLIFRWPFGAVSAKRLPLADVPALVKLLDDVARDTGAGFTATEAPAVVVPEPRILVAKAEPTPWVRPDEGAPLNEGTIKATQGAGAKMPGDCKAWIAARLAEATSVGRAIEGPVKSQRWLELCRALMNSAIAYHDRLDRDGSLLRSLLAAATGIAEAEQPGFTLGAVYGSLTIAEAVACADLMEHVYEGTKTLGFDVNGRPMAVAA